MTYQKIKAKFEKLIEKFFLINDSPHKIAAGAALGIFLGIFPGEGVTSALILATIFRFNRLAATIGVLTTNMWMTFLVLPIAAVTGAALFGKNYAQLMADYKETLEIGWSYFFGKEIFLDLTLPLLVGFLVVSGLIAFLFYAALYILLIKRKKHDSQNP